MRHQDIILLFYSKQQQQNVYLHIWKTILTLSNVSPYHKYAQNEHIGKMWVLESTV